MRIGADDALPVIEVDGIPRKIHVLSDGHLAVGHGLDRRAFRTAQIDAAMVGAEFAR